MQIDATEGLINWAKDHKRRALVGVAESSTLGLWHRLPVLSIKNPKTGRVVDFTHLTEVRCGTVDDELLMDVYTPTPQWVLRYPHLRLVELHIYND